MPKKLAEVAAEKVVDFLHISCDSLTAPAEKADIDLVHDCVIDAIGDALREDRAAAVKRVGSVVGTQFSLEGAFVPESRVRALAEALVDAAWGVE